MTPDERIKAMDDEVGECGRGYAWAKMDISDDAKSIGLDGAFTKRELEIIAKHMEDE